MIGFTWHSSGKFKFDQSLSEKVPMQCTKMQTHTEAYYPCKIKKTNHFLLF